jgi:4'-phosphopantetheinyl transferase EntD
VEINTRFGVVVVRPVAALAKAELLARLHPDEAALAAPWGELRVRTFVAGRLALREAIALVGGAVDGPLLRAARGAPLVGDHLRASVTHKDTVVAALASTDVNAGFVGIDVELFPGPKDDVASHVLTEVERGELALLDVDARRRALITRFSLKEALYKALDPFVQRYVGFLEVEARAHDDGTASFALALHKGEGPFVVDGAHQPVDGGVLTFARVSRRP